MLILFCSVIYITAVKMPNFSKAGAEEVGRAKTEFFTARASLVPADIDVTEEVFEAYGKLEKSGELPRQASTNKGVHDKIITELTKQKKRAKRSAVVGQELRWDFYDVKPIDPNQSLYIRFKYDVSVNPADLQVLGRWVVGDVRQIGSELVTPIYPFDRKDLIRTFHEIEVPADAIASDGYLAIVFYNDPQLNDTVVIFPPEDGLELLYKAGTFTSNFVKCAWLILCRLIFLACLGILASTFLSFPVAMLGCLVVFFTAHLSGFVMESFDYLSENLGRVYYFTVKPIIHLLPEFDKFNPSKFMVSGRLLDWVVLVKAVGFMVCIKAVLILLGALLIFRYKEVAKITV